MSWAETTIPVGTTGIDWAKVMATNAVVSLDPYLVLADLTDFKWLQRRGGKLPFIVQTTGGAYKLQRAARAAGMPPKSYQFGSVYKRSIWERTGPSKYLTVQIDPAQVLTFAKLGEVKRMQLGLPRNADIKGQPILSDKKTMFFPPRREPLVEGNPNNLWQPVIGVIDDGCAFAHQSFQVGMHSRVKKFWAQSNDLAPKVLTPSPAVPAYLGYGLEVLQSHVQLSGQHFSASGDLQFYKALNYLPLTLNRTTHGNGVMQLLAGSPALIFGKNSPFSEGRVTDVAAKSDIFFVQLDRQMLDDTAGGSLCVHALDALRYIVDRAETYLPYTSGGTKYDRVKRRVVVNLSYGTLGGPHDGTSPLECAIDEMIQKRKNLAVVAAAGNSKLQNCHASQSVKTNARLGWHVSPDNSIPSSLEIWFKKGADLSGLSVGLIAPNGHSVILAPGEIQLWTNSFASAPRGGVWAGAVFTKNAAQSLDRAMLLVFCGPTRFAADTKGLAPYGRWTIEVTNNGGKPVQVDYWVERNDSAYSRRRRQQSYLEDIDSPAVTEANTAANPASAQFAFAVGGYRLSDGEAAAYSSLGFAGATTFPAAYAPSDAGTMLRGLRVPGTISGTTSRIGGTSAAAPVFARWLVNWMGQNPAFTISFDDVKTHFADQMTNRPPGASSLPQPVIDDKYLLI